jgi:hypothetical protein
MPAGVFVPELPSVATQGETIEEAIEAYLEVMHEDGPSNPGRPPRQHCCPRGVSAKLPAVSGKQVIAAPERRASTSNGSAASKHS